MPLSLPTEFQPHPLLKAKVYHIGEVSRVHGIKGHLYIRLFHNHEDSEDKMLWLPLVQKLYFSQKPLSASLGEEKEEIEAYSFPLKTFRPFQKGFLAVLQEVQNRDEAEFFRGFQVHISKSDLQSKNKNKGQRREAPFWMELTDFHLAHAGKKWKAPIVGLSSNGAQILLKVAKEGRKGKEGEEREEEMLIPFVKEWLVKLDNKRKILFFHLPEGIEDLNKSQPPIRKEKAKKRKKKKSN